MIVHASRVAVGLPRRARTALGGAIALAFILLASRGEAASSVQVLHVPYPNGVSVSIIQGYNGGTHTGVERYSLDLTRSDGRTSGSPVLAPAAGSVAFAQVPGQEHGCIGVTMDDSGDYHYMLCHIVLDHVYSYGDRIQLGQSLGTVGAPGLVGNNGSAHIHMQLYTLPGGQRTPMPFSAPLGIPLEGLAMPADGTYDQWACAGVSCGGLISRLPSNGVVTYADTGNPTTSAAAALSATLSIGQTAVVQGTGDCLRVRAQPGLSEASLGCAPDGTVVYIGDGPKQSDGYTWWYLRTLGWSASSYLRPAATPGTSSLPSPGDAGPPNSAASSVATAALLVGASVHVSGTNDCLRLHASAALAAPVVNCLRDGSTAVLSDGPQQADGHTWWQLDSGAWAVADYLQPSP